MPLCMPTDVTRLICPVAALLFLTQCSTTVEEPDYRSVAVDHTPFFRGLKSGLRSDAKPSRFLDQGTRVELLKEDEKEAFSQIRLPWGEKGWVPSRLVRQKPDHETPTETTEGESSDPLGPVVTGTEPAAGKPDRTLPAVPPVPDDGLPPVRDDIGDPIIPDIDITPPAWRPIPHEDESADADPLPC